MSKATHTTVEFSDCAHVSCDGLSYDQQLPKDQLLMCSLSKRIHEYLGDVNVLWIPEDVADGMNDALNKLVVKHSLSSFKAHLVDYLLGLGFLSHHKHRRAIIASAIAQARLTMPCVRKIMIEGNEFTLYVDETSARCVGADNEFVWLTRYNTELRDE